MTLGLRLLKSFAWNAGEIERGEGSKGEARCWTGLVWCCANLGNAAYDSARHMYNKVMRMHDSYI